MDVNQVMELLGISQGKAYKVIRLINSELEREGYLTIQGKCSIKRLLERFGLEYVLSPQADSNSLKELNNNNKKHLNNLTI